MRVLHACVRVRVHAYLFPAHEPAQALCDEGDGADGRELSGPCLRAEGHRMSTK